MVQVDFKTFPQDFPGLAKTKFQSFTRRLTKRVYKACKLLPARSRNLVQFRPQNSLQKCQIKYFCYCKHAVMICKSYRGLDVDPARGGAGSKISRTTTL